MKIGGQWVGLGLNDSSEEILRIKDFMRKKFTYAKALSNTTVYDQPMAEAVTEMQSRYSNSGMLPADKYIPGVINVETKIVMGFIPRPAKPKPLLFTVCGTGVPWWIGPDADVARAVETKYRWQPIGYPAAPFPMAKSVAQGRVELCRQVELWRSEIENNCKAAAFIGYSQGAIVTSECWEYDIKPESGRLNWFKPYLVRAATFGNPMRETGKVWPDGAGGLPAPDSHGIADQLMVDTPSWWRNYAHKGDLYTDCAGQSGEDKTAIYKIIMGTRVMSGPDSLLRQLLEASGAVKDAAQIIELTGLFKAIMDAGLFFGAGTKPHINYSTIEATQHLMSL
jgi:hypothetical protein